MTQYRIGISLPSDIPYSGFVIGGGYASELLDITGLEPPHFNVYDAFNLSGHGRRFTYREALGREIIVQFKMSNAPMELAQLLKIHTGIRVNFNISIIDAINLEEYHIPSMIVTDVKLDFNAKELIGSITLYKEDVYIRLGEEPTTIPYTPAARNFTIPIVGDLGVDFVIAYRASTFNNKTNFILTKDGVSQALDLGKPNHASSSEFCYYRADVTNHQLYRRTSTTVSTAYLKVDPMDIGATTRPYWFNLTPGNNVFRSVAPSVIFNSSRSVTYADAIMGF